MFKELTLIACLFAFTATAQLVDLSTTDVDFGSVTYGLPMSQSITISNPTDAALELEEIILFDVYDSSPFTVSSAGMSIPANGSLTLEIEFDPVHNINHNTEMIIKTSGNRGAISVDIKGSCDYPGNYYDDTHDEIDQDLKEALNDILGDGYISHSYNNARDEMFMEIDNQQVNGQGSSQTRLTRAYLGTDAVGYTGRTDLFQNYSVNTEHTFPQGTFNESLPMRSDVHHLFPTDEDANFERGSLRFGNVVGGVTWSGGGSQKGQNAAGQLVFEPRDAQKGLSARAILYFLVRYQNYGGHVTADMESTVLGWHNEFPPTSVDIQRNEDIFDYQNNRNPFVDYPQLVDRIFSFRSDQDRPNIGELVVSHTEANFGIVEAEAADFNVVLANIGERFFNVSAVSVVGAGFSLGEDQDDAFLVSNGEARSIRVNFDPSVAAGLSTGTLTFETNLASSPLVSIPLSAEGVLGIRNLNHLGIVLHPNPAQDVFRLSGETSRIQSVQLLDLQGREVRAYASPSAVYPLEAVSNGIYLVKVYFQNGSSGIQRLAVSR